MSSIRSSEMGAWNKEELEQIRSSDDLHISPLRADGVTHGTPTWIWSVVVEDQLFVRAYNGRASRWYQSAVTQKAGRIRAVGRQKEVSFQTVEDPGLNVRIDAAYRAKYTDSSYLEPMIGERARAATILIVPDGEHS